MHASIKVAPGWKAVLFEDDDYKGDSLEVARDIADLDDYHMNDKVTAVTPPPSSPS